jgi:predicted membrane chloride channel (bestrophin family)
VLRILKAKREGVVHDSVVLEQTLLDTSLELRGTYASIPQEVDGRMPLAYAHFVQVLVDFFLFAAPLALYIELGGFTIFSVGMFTIFYEGLLDLAKVFLDPLENEDYCDGGIEMDLGVLIRETNAGSIRWKNCLATLPFETK